MTPVQPIPYNPFNPVLFSSKVLEVSDEQKLYIREVLKITSSDSLAAKKAAEALTVILTKGSVVIPTVTTITPGSATIGDPSFTLHVHGTNFDAMSAIVWNGGVEVTTFVSPTELTTEVNMATAEVATTIPVAVQSGDGVLSNSMPFVIQAAGPTGLRQGVSFTSPKPVVGNSPKPIAGTTPKG